jgi:hypothetical protein
MNATGVRWVLAFDASCATCREVSAAVAQACGDKLEVLPLTHEDVRQWRAAALGTPTPWTPALLRVDDGKPRAWTGTAMAIALVRHLGLPSTIQVLRALGRLRRHESPAAQASSRTLSRAGFFQLAAGVVAAGAIMAKTSPAQAMAEQARGGARAWVEANKGRLPQRYDEFVRHPMAHRRAIFAELTPEARSRLWIAHLRDYATSHPGLTARQRTALDQAVALVATTALFAPGGRSADLRRRADHVAEDVRQVFGNDEAVALVATLGPAESADTARPMAAAARPECSCSQGDDWCSRAGTWCDGIDCVRSDSGCGSWWSWPCDGLCSCDGCN